MIIRQPYPGLRPFEIDEADIFFGREEQTDELLSRLNTTRFLAIIGASGCGKSSLVRAGMIPALETGFMAAAGSRWQFVQMRPGSHPIRRLATALIEQAHILPEDMDRTDALGFLNATLRRGPIGLVEALNHTPLPPQTNLLVLVDQFEEIFRFRREGDRDEADAFVALLIASAQQRDMPIYVAITMRSDFIGDCALFNGLPEALNQSQYLTPRLTREQQHMAIVGPARVFGGDVEPELVNSLLNEMGTDPDQLPLLQHLLMRLWDCAGLPKEAANIPQTLSDMSVGRLLTMQTYEAVGGLKHALSNHIDEAYGELSDKQQSIAEMLFRRLSERGTDQRDIRRPTSASEIEALAGIGLEELIAVVEAFRAPSRSFLVPRYPEPIYTSTVLDITHESLIRQWKRLRVWSETEAQAADTYRFLEQSARRWEQGLSGLWRTPDLETALAWKEREQPSAIWAQRYGGDFELAMRFLDASEQERKAEETLAEARRKKELLGELRLRRTRWLARAGAMMAVLLGCVIGFYFFGWRFPYKTYSTGFTKQWGTIHPIGILPKSAVSHRSSTLRLTREGWFGKIQMLEVIDANHILTPNNSIVNYLADPNAATEREKESRYEFIYDHAGNVVYEIASDRHGHVAWSFMSPPYQQKASIPSMSRRGMFLGSDGSIQPQGNSRAEFVDIRYGTNGFETELRYFDRESRPMPGPDDAYGQRREYDEAGREIRRTSLNAHGKPMVDAAGNASMEARYDQNGNVIEENAFDAKGEPTLLKAGFYRRTSVYDKWGRLTEQRFFNLSGEPAVDIQQTGAHHVLWEYDDGGNMKSIKLYDTADRPIVAGGGLFEFPAHERQATFDSQNRLEAVAFLDQDKKPLSGSEGWQSYRIEYDERGFVSAASFFDGQGHPISQKTAGFHRWWRLNDEFGQPIEERFFDTEGKPVTTLDEGYHIRKNEYDKAGNLTVQAYFNVEGKPTVDKNYGVHRVAITFDRFRHPTFTQYFNVTGNPTNNNQGFHREESNYDDYGAPISTVWYDKDGWPTNGPDGINRVSYEYDSRGLLTRIIRRDTNQQPVTDKNGISETLYDYNGKRQQTKWQFFGLGRKPAEDEEGDHLILMEFDESGRETKITRLRADGSPNWDRELGIATRKQTWDKENRWIEQSYYDTKDHMIIGPHGFAKSTLEYTPDGRVVQVNFGADGNPAFNPLSGWAIKKVDQQKRGDTIESYHGPDGALITGPEGFAEVRIRWGEDGKSWTVAWFGADGAPVMGPGGYHRIERTSGSLSDSTKYFDINGRELPSLGSDVIVFVIYIAQIDDIKQPAAKAGLQAGDILWKYGNWSFPDALATERSKATKPDQILSAIWKLFVTERNRLSTESAPVTVIRNGQQITMIMPPLQHEAIGINSNVRAVPVSTFEEWKAAVAKTKTEPGIPMFERK
jgi:YD repeat-containing protein